MSLRSRLTQLLRKKFPKLTAADIAREVNNRVPVVEEVIDNEPVTEPTTVDEPDIDEPVTEPTTVDDEPVGDEPVVEDDNEGTVETFIGDGAETTIEIVEDEPVGDEPVVEDVLTDDTEVSPIIGDAPSDAPSGIDVTKISGIGKAMKVRLAEAGITTVEQIAQMTPEHVADVDAMLDFKGRIDRDRWVQKAKELLA